MLNIKPENIRVLMVTGDFPPQISGVGDYSWHVSRTLQASGANVTVITTKNPGTLNEQFSEHLDIRSIMSYWKISEIDRIIKVLRETSDKTVVNIQYYCPTTYGRRLMINFIPALIRLLSPEARVVLTMHGFWEQSKFFRLRTLPMLRAAHGVIYVDRLNEEKIRKYSGLKGSRLKHIPIAGNIPPVPCSPELRATWRREIGLAERDVAVAFFGGIGRNKGFEYLLEAAAKIRGRQLFPVVVMAIGGFHADIFNNSAYKSEIEALIDRLDLAGQVRIIESPDPAGVSKYLHAADLAVYPFLNGVGENSGSMLAALAHGLPTIITAGPANAASFIERFGVGMVPARDALLLAEKIEEVVFSQDLRSTMRSKALSVSKRFSWDYVAGETLQFFSDLI